MDKIEGFRQMESLPATLSPIIDQVKSLHEEGIPDHHVAAYLGITSREYCDYISAFPELAAIVNAAKARAVITNLRIIQGIAHASEEDATRLKAAQVMLNAVDRRTFAGEKDASETKLSVSVNLPSATEAREIITNDPAFLEGDQ
jgi:hypothetical protein